MPIQTASTVTSTHGLVPNTVVMPIAAMPPASVPSKR